MKRLLILLSLFVLLTACGTSEARYRVMFKTQDPGAQQELLLASMRLISQRMNVIGVKLDDQNIERKDGNVTIVVKLPGGTVRQIAKGSPVLTKLEQQAPKILDHAPKDLLTEQLTKPFSLRLMLESPEAGADVVTSIGSFKATGITEASLAVVQAAPAGEGKGKILLVFTKDGEVQIAKLFHDHKGKTIGLFLRDRVVSTVTSAGESKKNFIIDGVPSMELANQFADEVNVGLYVTFTSAD